MPMHRSSFRCTPCLHNLGTLVFSGYTVWNYKARVVLSHICEAYNPNPAHSLAGGCAKVPPPQRAASFKLVSSALAQLQGAADPLLPAAEAAAQRVPHRAAHGTGSSQVRYAQAMSYQ